MTSEPSRRGLHPRFTFLFCAVAACLPLWGVKYLPMTDFPQHAAQVFLWARFDDPALDIPRHHELHYFTPYLLGYGLARIVTSVTGIFVGMKLMITFAILGFAGALAWLLRRVGGEPGLALIAFPLGFGLSFYWGLYSYLVALPLIFLFLGLVARHAENPTGCTYFGIGVAAVVLFFSHVLVMGLALVAGGLWIVLEKRPPAATFRLLLPFLAPLPIIVVWLAQTTRAHAYVQNPASWGAGPIERIALFPGLLLGEGRDPHARVFGSLLILLLVLAGRPRRGLHRFGPFLAAAGIYLLAPHNVFGNDHTNSRFAVLVLPLLLLGWEARPMLMRRVIPITLLTLHVLWMSVLYARFRGFDEDARQFDEIARHIEPASDVVAVNHDPFCDWIPGHAPFLHFVAWNQAEKGGLIGFSAAWFHPQVVRYREGGGPKTTPMLESDPTLFDWNTDGGFDYYVVRIAPEATPTPFLPAPPDVRHVETAGRWRLYHRPRGGG